MRQQVKQKEEELAAFQSQYQQVERAYALFRSLSGKVAREITGIFKASTPAVFIACGTQADNIDTLWEYTKQQIITGQTADVGKLIELLTFFLKLYNSLFDQPPFAWQTVRSGDEFDAAKHIRTADSKVSGRITQVYLPGYINANTEKLIKKSVVRM
ncbi:hypothetical protein [Heliophilum fasciatum]|uniref:Uncharacterized protein n=1 Tax=Heliophilum fasciatum TaxID=35700 RepID=A0A4R2RGL3_9FIRM|nr:hypothetical protein [Heliophilum fasciatum]MCW2279142.1 hypothetical protein [Heliophilum fasciatum]TCP61227.1 hypothetical protein EDD73_13019 [Heliophilum fasciatum]